MVRRVRALVRVFFVEHLEVSLPRLAQLQNGSQVARAVAVVRSRPHLRLISELQTDCANLAVEEVLVAVHGNLMRATHELQSVDLVELLRHISAEDPASTAEVALEATPYILGTGVPFNIRLRIGPEEIGIQSLVCHLLEAVDAVDVIDGADEGRKSSVDAHDLVVDERSNTHAVEHVHQVLPSVGVSVLLHALIVETVHLRDLSSLVVASQEGDAVRVTGLQSEEQLDGFYTEVAAVDVVSHENVFGVGHIASDAEQLLQIVELTVNVATHSAGGGDGLWVIRMSDASHNDVGFLHHNILHNAAKQLQFVLLQRCLLPQLRNPRVQIRNHSFVLLATTSSILSASSYQCA